MVPVTACGGNERTKMQIGSAVGHANLEMMIIAGRDV